MPSNRRRVACLYCTPSHTAVRASVFAPIVRDMRFHLKVDTWRHPSCTPIYAMSAANPQGPTMRRAAARGSSAPCVALATAGAEVSVWDLCGNDLRASLRIGAANASVDDVVIRTPPRRAGGGAYGVDAFASDGELGLRAGGYSGGSPRADGSARSAHHVCGITSSSDGQYMLTAGTDSIIRCATRRGVPPPPHTS